MGGIRRLEPAFRRDTFEGLALAADAVLRIAAQRRQLAGDLVDIAGPRVQPGEPAGHPNLLTDGEAMFAGVAGAFQGHCHVLFL